MQYIYESTPLAMFNTVLQGVTMSIRARVFLKSQIILLITYLRK